MDKIKYEQDCKYPFYISCKFKSYGTKGCEISLENGNLLSYMPIPDDVRYCFSNITKFYKSEEGQKIIESKIQERWIWYETRRYSRINRRYRMLLSQR